MYETFESTPFTKHTTSEMLLGYLRTTRSVVHSTVAGLVANSLRAIDSFSCCSEKSHRALFDDFDISDFEACGEAIVSCWPIKALCAEARLLRSAQPQFVRMRIVLTLALLL
jgi:hypothetical protein